MKVKITAASKRIITIAEMPKVQEIIKYFQEEDETPINDYARWAANIVTKHTLCNPEILKATAEITKNARANDSILEGSGNLDVWFEFYIFDKYAGFYEIGAYLTDIWQATDENNEYIKSHMYINAYTKNK
jgi:hypothetical protein